MRKVKVQPLSLEEFAPFGQYYSMTCPDGYPFVGEIHKFFPDRIVADSQHRIGFSPLIVNKPDKMIITQQEYHTTTWEIILPLEDDIILHVAPVSGGKPVPDYVKAFLVPKNTMVKLNTAVWHLAAIPANKDKAITLVVLPEATYANDCYVVDLKEDEQFEIVL